MPFDSGSNAAILRSSALRKVGLSASHFAYFGALTMNHNPNLNDVPFDALDLNLMEGMAWEGSPNFD